MDVKWNTEKHEESVNQIVWADTREKEGRERAAKEQQALQEQIQASLQPKPQAPPANNYDGLKTIASFAAGVGIWKLGRKWVKSMGPQIPGMD